MAKSYKPSQEQPKIILFDHDETLSFADPVEAASLLYAFHFASRQLKLPKDSSLDVEMLRLKTKGTTEKFLVDYYCALAAMPPKLIEQFHTYFYFGRSKWYANMLTDGEYIVSNYYSDAVELLDRCVRSIGVRCGLVTGNPEAVAKVKVAPNVLRTFTHKRQIMAAFGDQASTRQELLHKVVEKIQAFWPEFSVELDNLGFAKNVFYIADSEADFFAGLDCHYRVIWVPSRTLSEVKQVAASKPIAYIAQMLKKQTLITNNLLSPSVLKFLNLDEK